MIFINFFRLMVIFYYYYLVYRCLFVFGSVKFMIRGVKIFNK